MKFLTEYRDPELVQEYLKKIHRITTRPWTLMEICGGQTHSLVKNGILDMLPEKITMVHGPGCPVCVTSLSVIDEAIYLAEQSGVIFCSFGDMLRVPGSTKSLLEVKAAGAESEFFTRHWKQLSWQKQILIKKWCFLLSVSKLLRRLMH